MNTKEDIIKTDFIKKLKTEDYCLYYTYYTMDDVREIIRGEYLLPVSDTPVPVRVKGIDFILFKSNKLGILSNWMCIQNGDKYKLYEMSAKAYNEYEKYISNLT
jgi:hypothetical protein